MIKVGDLSGLTATGRPISASSSRLKKPIKRSNYIPDQHTPTSSLPSKSPSEAKVSAGAVPEMARPHSVMLSRNDKPKVWRSVSSEDRLWNHMSQQARDQDPEKQKKIGTFAANFYQSFMKQPKDGVKHNDSVATTTSNGTTETSKVETRKGWTSAKTRYTLFRVGSWRPRYPPPLLKWVWSF
jgi:hypothetical protein